MLTVAPAATASVIVYPARIETEVPAAGIVKEIVLENRGAFPIEARLSIGTGTHGVDGAPLFRDGAEHQTAGERFVRLGTDTLIVPPGEHRSFEVGLRSTPGAVAAYPVIFVEVHPAVTPDETSASVVSAVPRFAIPLLLSYEGTRDQRAIASEIDTISLTPVDGSPGLFLVDVVVRNSGNVHGWVRGRIDWLNASGQVDEVSLLPELRVLPGATRRFQVEWRPELPHTDEIRLLTTMYGDGWSAPSIPAAFHVPAGLLALSEPVEATILAVGEHRDLLVEAMR